MAAQGDDLDLSSLSPKQFEELVYDLLAAEGYRNLDWRDGGADGGRDIAASTFATDASGCCEERKWYCDAKLYGSGIGFEAIHSTLSKATAHSVDYLLLAVWPHLTPPCKDDLASWKATNQPRFRDRVWEKKDIADRLLKHPAVLRKHLPTAWAERLEVDALLRESVGVLRELRARVSSVWKNPDRRPLSDLLAVTPKRREDQSAELVDTTQVLLANERALLVGLVEAHEHLELLLAQAFNVDGPTAFLRGRWNGRPDVRLLLPIPLAHLLRPEVNDGVARVLAAFEKEVPKGTTNGILTGASRWRPIRDRNAVAVYALFPEVAPPDSRG